MGITQILIGIIGALAMLLAVFIAQAIAPKAMNKAFSQIRNNKQDIELLKQELKFIREDLHEIKVMLKERNKK